MAIVYVLSNPAFEGYVKVGRTTDLEQRLRQLDTTSVPLPFRCEYAIAVEDDAKAERLVHQAFADVRVRKNREFFEIDAQRIISALKLTGGVEVTPKEDIAEDEEGVAALERSMGKRRTYHFSDAKVNVGDELVFTRDEEITAVVVGERKIEFEGGVTSLSGAALTLLHRQGYKWKQANGWAYWMKDGETLGERVDRFAAELDEE